MQCACVCVCACMCMCMYARVCEQANKQASKQAPTGSPYLSTIARHAALQHAHTHTHARICDVTAASSLSLCTFSLLSFSILFSFRVVLSCTLRIYSPQLPLARDCHTLFLSVRDNARPQPTTASLYVYVYVPVCTYMYIYTRARAYAHV